MQRLDLLSKCIRIIVLRDNMNETVSLKHHDAYFVLLQQAWSHMTDAECKRFTIVRKQMRVEVNDLISEWEGKED